MYDTMKKMESLTFKYLDEVVEEIEEDNVVQLLIMPQIIWMLRWEVLKRWHNCTRLLMLLIVLIWCWGPLES